MNVSLTLSEEQVWLIQNALFVVSGHETENLEYIKPEEYEQKKDSIDALRQMVTQYMTLRRAILQRWARAESEMDAQTTNEIERNGLNIIVENWNRQIARIKGKA